MLGERAEFPVSQMARVLEVSRSGFYSWLASDRPRDDWSAERDAVMRVWPESDRRFEFRFVHAILPPESSRLTRYRVLKLMRELGIRGCTPNARKLTTIPSPMTRPRPDLMRRDLTGPVPTYKLVSGITYLHTDKGWLHLVTVVDLCTRIVVGWPLSDRTTIDIAVAALESAKSRGYVARNAIFHSDRGAQYKQDFVRVDAGQRTTCAFPAAAPATATTTPWPSRSSPRRRTRCTTAGASRPATPPSTPSSSSSRPTTTASGPIRPSATRCRRRLWSRSSSARSPNQSLFP